MDYSNFLPDIDVEDGKKRIMENMSLYARLLGRFECAKMTDNIIAAIDANDEKALLQAAHALKGTAANLSFPTVFNVVSEIDSLCKDGSDCSHLKQGLLDATASLDAAIKRFLATL
ncbi:MAG: Hpt domain-containing protein [Defluviitaleaceae bacterium]|nr:Hpt domain-containing protein [Defluviitaleaceae bacterium]